MMENKFQDPILGEIVWEEDNEWWKGTTEIQPGLKIEVNLSVQRDRLIENIAQFRAVFENFRQNEANARLCAAEHLLEIHNESWRDDDEEEITPEEFCRRIQPESIGIEGDNSASIFYHDGDLFWGHVIIVSMDETGNFTDATIAG